MELSKKAHLIRLSAQKYCFCHLKLTSLSTFHLQVSKLVFQALLPPSALSLSFHKRTTHSGILVWNLKKICHDFFIFKHCNNYKIISKRMKRFLFWFRCSKTQDLALQNVPIFFQFWTILHNLALIYTLCYVPKIGESIG